MDEAIVHQPLASGRKGTRHNVRYFGWRNNPKNYQKSLRIHQPIFLNPDPVFVSVERRFKNLTTIKLMDNH